MYFFYGKKDKTKFKYEIDGEFGKKVFMGHKNEEHVSVCSEPGGKYLCHFTPAENVPGTSYANSVANGLLEFLISRK